MSFLHDKKNGSKFRRNRPFDGNDSLRNRSFKLPKSNETHGFSGRDKTFFGRDDAFSGRDKDFSGEGYPEQNWEHSIQGRELGRINPNLAFSREHGTISAWFYPTLDIPREHRSIAPPFYPSLDCPRENGAISPPIHPPLNLRRENGAISPPIHPPLNLLREHGAISPPLDRNFDVPREHRAISPPFHLNCDFPRRYDAVTSHFHDKSCDFSRKCDARSKNPMCDRKSSDAPRFQTRRNQNWKKKLMTQNSYVRKRSDYDSSSCQARGSKGSISKLNQTDDVWKISDYDSPSCQARGSEGPISKLNQTDDVLRKHDSASPRCQFTSRKTSEGPIPKLNQTDDVSRKHDSAPRCQFTPRRNSEEPIAKVNPARDLSRKYASFSPRYHLRTSEKPNEGLIVKVNPTRDSVSSGFQVRASDNRKEGSIVKLKPTRDHVPPRFHMKTSEKRNEGPTVKVNPTIDPSSKFSVFSKSLAKNCEKTNELSIVTRNPTHGFMRTSDGGNYQVKVGANEIIKDSVEVRTNEITKDSAVQKLNSSSASLRKRVGVAPQVPAEVSEYPKEANPSHVLLTSDVNMAPSKSPVSSHSSIFHNVNADHILPKLCWDSHKEVTVLERFVTNNCMGTCDVDSPQFEGKASNNLKEVRVEKGNLSNVVSRKRVGVFPQIQMNFSECLNNAKSSEVIVTSVQNSKSIKSAKSRDNFKIRKVSASRKFPKHCGALAPRVSLRNSTKEMEVSSSNLGMSDKVMSKVVKEYSEGVKPGLKTNKVEEEVNNLPAEEVEKMVVGSILPNDFHKVSDKHSFSKEVNKVLSDPVSRNDPERYVGVESVDPKDDVAPTGEQIQYGGMLEGNVEENDWGEKLKNAQTECFDMEVCSDNDNDTVDDVYLHSSDLLPTQDKHEGVRQIYSDDRSLHREQVKEVKDSYQRILAKLVEHNKAAESEGKEKVSKQPFVEAAMIMKRHNQWVNTKDGLGRVPGIDVGDTFLSRAELVCIGLHSQFQSGIGYMIKEDGTKLATSIVASGRYANDAESPSSLRFCGQGGNPTLGRDKKPHDQKLIKGNLAMHNSWNAKTPVRVIRKNIKSIFKYYYDGLYVVTEVEKKENRYGKLEFVFHLNRIISGEATISKVEKLPCSLVDISQGKEKIPIHVVNTIDDEPVPLFTYITSMAYPDSCYNSMVGCGCTDGCSDRKKCKCVDKNGCEVFDENGCIMVRPKSKPFIYECGSSCTCPPSCKNRVTQYGIRHQLEVFKTESRGWGLRSRSYIPARSFVCEYVGELLQDEEAEKRTDNDEYLFDIHNDGFTIDAAKYGNVGRFMNHSCSPNLYGQDVLYDHDDKKMSHVMFFTVNGILPFEELTYDYNYKLDKVLDSDGNIKKKACHCGSKDCIGRLY